MVSHRGSQPLDDLWTFAIASETWSERATSDGPNERGDHAMVVDRASGPIYLFGGFEIENVQRNDLWMLELPA